MEKNNLIILLIILIGIFLISGCAENNNENNTNELYTKTVYMDAQELVDDFIFTTKISGGKMQWIYNYKTLNEGDTLILTDQICNITYQSFMYNATIIHFDVENYSKMGVNASEVSFFFEGNLIDEYFIGDTVTIIVTIKHIIYTNETNGMSLDMEVFEENWDEDNFIQNFFSQILPRSCISKI